MAFRALLFSKSPETNTAITTACESTGIRAEICSDIFTAIEKGKTRAFSCVIADWAEQPEASFLLKRARESAPNRNSVLIAIVDHDPTPAEMRDNQLGFLIYRPISAMEADSVLAKACEQMQPLSAAEAAEPSGYDSASQQNSPAISAGAASTEHSQHNPPAGLTEENAAGNNGENASDTETDNDNDNGNDTCSDTYTAEQSRGRLHAPGFRGVLAAVLVLSAAFCLWRSRETILYLSQTPEGRIRVLKESAAALFYVNRTGALPVGSAGSDAQQDSYFSRNPGSSSAPTPALGIVATESTLTESHTAAPKPFDFPLPTPVFEHQDPVPVVRERAAIPESMKNSPRIERPVVVTVNPSQMMVPVSAPQSQQPMQQFSEPVAISEQAARALLVHTVDPVYPPEALAQKLHGPVVLQALIARDGTVDDLKIVRGYFVLGKAAIAAVKQWRFQPYIVGGHAAATQTVITIDFSFPPG